MFLLGRVLALAFLMLLPAQAHAAVKLEIVVIHAKRAGKPAMPAKLKQMKIDDDLKKIGFTNAKILDQLPATVEKTSSVSLEISNPFAKSKQMLSVKVLEVNDKNIKLRVALPSQKFKADTSQKKGASLVLVVPPEKNGSNLVLAVRPIP